MQYSLLTPRKIVFGWGRRSEIGKLGRSLGRRAWIVSGSRTLAENGTLAELRALLTSAGVASELLTTITHEPEVADIDESLVRLIDAGIREGDFVIGIGGGAGMDTAKAIAALATNRHGESVQDFLEGVGQGLTIDQEPLPFLAMPTTAGTGSEATKNAVISSYDPPFKKSLRSERMVADIVLVDPELTISCPPGVTAQSGMDAITQLIESAISRRSNPYIAALCREGLARALACDENGEAAIVRAVEHPEDRDARESMSHAALLSGIALANSGLGMAHGVAAALGVHCQVPHGLACAVMLPIALEVNSADGEPTCSAVAVLTDQYRPDNESADERKHADAPGAAGRAPSNIRGLNRRLGIPARLDDLGVSESQIPAIVESSHGNSMNGNPRDITDDELIAILTANL